MRHGQDFLTLFRCQKFNTDFPSLQPPDYQWSLVLPLQRLEPCHLQDKGQTSSLGMRPEVLEIDDLAPRSCSLFWVAGGDVRGPTPQNILCCITAHIPHHQGAL